MMSSLTTFFQHALTWFSLFQRISDMNSMKYDHICSPLPPPVEFSYTTLCSWRVLSFEPPAQELFGSVNERHTHQLLFKTPWLPQRLGTPQPWQEGWDLGAAGDKAKQPREISSKWPLTASPVGPGVAGCYLFRNSLLQNSILNTKLSQDSTLIPVPLKCFDLKLFFFISDN